MAEENFQGLLGSVPWNPLADNQNTLLALAGGFLSGNPGAGFANASRIGLYEDQNAAQRRALAGQQLATMLALRQRGITGPELAAAASNPEYLKLVSPIAFPQYEPFTQGPYYGRRNKMTGQVDIQGVVPEFKTVGPGQEASYVTPPVPGGPNQAPGAPSSVPVLSGGPQNPPPGYQWADKKDASKGLIPIEGGPAAKLQEGAAGHLALIQSAQPGLQQAREYFLSPDFRKGGALQAAGMAVGQATGSFDIGRAQRAVAMATEAALRTASGAAVPEQEVKRYANFYTPSVYDSEATRKQKLDALQRFNDYAVKNITQGHTVPLAQIPSPSQFMNEKTVGGMKEGQWTTLPGGVLIRERR